MAREGVVSISYLVNNDSFNSKIGDMKKNLQLMQTQVKNSAKEIDVYGSNIQTLAKKQDSINQAIKQTEKIMNSYNQQLEKNKTALSKNQSELDSLAAKKKELNSQYKQAVKMYGQESEEAQKLKEQLSQTAAEYDKIKGKVEANKSNIQNYTTQLERQRTTLLDLQGQLKQTNEEIEKQGNKFTEASQKFADYSGKLEKAGVKLEEVGEVAMTAGTAILTAATGLATMSIEMDSQLSVISGRLGLTTEQSEELKEAALRLYENGFGESLPDCIDDVVLLQQVLGDTTNVTGEERDRLLEYIETIKSLFGADTQELLRTANNMVKTGLVGSFEEAMNVITVGYQQNLNYQGDFLDTLNEYSSQYTQLGFDVQDVLAMLSKGVEAGAFNTDKLADSVKEFGLRVREGSDDTKEAFNSMGLDAGDMLNKFSQGGDAAKNAFYDTLDAISKIEDPMKRNKIGVALMGTQWEDVGEKAILAMKDARNATIDVTDATAKAGQEINDSMATKMETVMRRLKDSLADMGKALLPAVESVTEGIEDLTKFISKLNPEVVKSIAKFGAMALAFGGVTKATGSLVTGIAKGASGLSKFLKIVADTKSLGSFTKALAASETATGGLISSVGGLGKAFASLGTAGAIGGAIAVVGSLGVAFYNNQKEIEESEAKLREMGDTYQDFTGRLRTQESIWTQIFGKEYNIVFGDDYKTALANTEQDVATWVEELKKKQEEINTILNSTEKSPETKKEELKKLTNLMPEVNKEEKMSNFEKGLDEDNIGEKGKKRYKESYSKLFDDSIKNIDEAGDKVAEVIANNLDEEGNITEEGLEKIKEINKSVQDDIAFVKSDSYETQLAGAESYIRDEQAMIGNANKGTIEAEKNKIATMGKMKKEELEEDKKNLKDRSGMWESEKEQQRIAIDKMIQNEDIFTDAKQKSLTRRGLYDAEYAKNHNLIVQDIEGGLTRVTDKENGLSMVYAENSTALQNYAKQNGLNYKLIEDASGNMMEVVTTDMGEVVAVLDSTSANGQLFGSNMESSLQKYIDAVNNGEMTTEEAMAGIKGDLESGAISAEAFGMTDSEFLKVGESMLTAKGDGEAFRGELSKLPKNVETKVEAKIYGKENVTDLWNSVSKFAGKTFTATVNVVQKGVSHLLEKGFGINFETGGTVNEAGVYTTQEAGLELIDTASPSQTAYSLADVARGELTYIPANSKVTNAAMTTLKMKSMIDDEVKSTVDLYMAGFEKKLLAVMKGNNSNGDFIVNMNNPHFENKESEQQNISNIKRIVKSMK